MNPCTSPRTTQQAQGFIVITILIMTIAITAIATATMVLITSNYQVAQGETHRLQAQLAADAAADYGVQQLNVTPDWTGTSSEVLLFEDASIKTTYTVSVTNDISDSMKKTMTVIGKAYAPKTNPTPRSERKYEIQLRGVGGGNYSIVTGVGGLNMYNNSKIVGGNVFVNGTISLSNSATIGLSTSPVNVQVAHQDCPVPPDSTYPKVCASGENGEPISINNLATIYGEVKATNQTNGNRMYNPGLTANSTVAPLALPVHDRDAQAAATTAANTISGSSAGCISGTRTWPANLKITGDVTVTNGCKVTVEGDVWITGELNVSNSGSLIVKSGLSEPPEIMVDGAGGAEFTNSAQLISAAGTPPIGFRIITYWSKSACTTQVPTCNLTGAALADSQTTTTIKLSNNATAPNTELYAKWTQLDLSNSGNVGALVAQTVKLTNSATVTFGTSVSNLNTPSAWVIDSYRRIY